MCHVLREWREWQVGEKVFLFTKAEASFTYKFVYLKMGFYPIFPVLTNLYLCTADSGMEIKMGTWELFLIAVGLSMDAFAVAVCKGLSVKQLKLRHALLTGLYFGLFQALMPLAGYALGTQFQEFITDIDHWIAFVLLCLIGINMIREACSKETEVLNDSFRFAVMLPLALATSIDALAVGVTFSFLQVNILPAVLFIGIITFGLSAVGVKIGHVFGTKYKSFSEFLGGLVLIAMGIKILLEHLGWLPL